MPLALSEALRRAGEIDSTAIDAVVRSPALRGRGFALRLYQSGLVSAEVIFQTLLKQGARDATPRLTQLPAARLLALIPSRLAEEGCMVPLVRTGNRLHVAMLDPSDAKAIEDVALFTGFAVEPFVAHARELFRARYQAYGIPAPTPLARFTVGSALASSLLPPPPHDVIPAIASRSAAARSSLAPLRMTAAMVGDEDLRPSLFGQQSGSPLAASLAALDPDQLPVAAAEPVVAPTQDPPPAVKSVATATASSPRVDGWGHLGSAQARVSGWSTNTAAESAPLGSSTAEALAKLATQFSRVALFLVNRDLAVGWDAAGGRLSRQRIRDVLLPLEPPSSLRLAVTTGRAVMGDIDQAESVDRMLINLMGDPTPTQWRVVPLLGAAGVAGLLYVDTVARPIDDHGLALADAVATDLARALPAR